MTSDMAWYSLDIEIVLRTQTAWSSTHA